MSLISFSSEGRRDDSDAPARPPRRNGALVVAAPSPVSGTDSDKSEVAFDLPMDGGLDIFSPEKRAEAQSDAVALPTQPVPTFAKKNPPVQPVLAPQSSVTTPATRSKAPSPTPPEFVYTRLEEVSPVQHATQAVPPPVTLPPPAVVSKRIEDVAPIHTSTPPLQRPAKEAHSPLFSEPVAAPVPRNKPSKPKARATTSPHWRRYASPQTAIVLVLVVGGAIEAGWIGLRVAGALSGPRAGSATGAPVAAPPPVAAAQATGTAAPQAANQPAAPALNVSAPPSATPKAVVDPKLPVWVLISTTVPVEIFEGGRRVGSSWGGGLRLSPGTHDLHIVNRALSVEALRSVEIVAGRTTTLMVEVAEGRLRVEAKRSE